MRKLLIDGNHLAGRCHATVGELKTDDGRLSGTVFGFLQGLSYVKNTLKIPFYDMIVFWDGGRSSVRMGLYPEYKGGRKWGQKDLSPEEVAEKEGYYAQLNALQENLGCIGVRQVKVRGVEADDLLGIYSNFYSERNSLVTIYSGDSDLYQCVSEKVNIFKPKEGVVTLSDIESRYKFPVKYFPIFKAITGDVTDNISGIKGVGEVRARVYIDSLLGKPVKDKDLKWIELINSKKDVLERNLKLVTIPLSWCDSLYTSVEEEAAILQLLERPVQKTDVFIKFLESWNLNSLLDNLRRWV